MQATSAASRTVGQPGGVIDTLTAGYLAINKQVWILLLPIMLDLFLWQGPQISLSPVVQPLVVHATEVARQASETTPSPAEAMMNKSSPAGTGAQTGERAVEGATLEAMAQEIMARSDSTNTLGLLSHGPLAVPSVAALLGGAGAFSFVDEWLDAISLVATALLGGFLLGSFYRGVIAQGVLGKTPPRAAHHAIRRLPVDAARVLGLLATLFGVLLVMGVPVLLLVAGATLIAPAVGVLGTLLLAAAVLFAEVHLFFAVDAIFVSGVGPLAAIQGSVGLVRRYLGSTLGLILLSWLILVGMDRVWEAAATQLSTPYGRLLGILGNAYITSGLVAASMIFYRDRLPSLEASAAEGAPSGG